MHIAPHLLCIDDRSALNIAPLNTTTSTTGAYNAITKYPPGVEIIFVNISPAVSGNAGICSCSHIDGITTPMAATALHARVAHGFD